MQTSNQGLRETPPSNPAFNKDGRLEGRQVTLVGIVMRIRDFYYYDRYYFTFQRGIKVTGQLQSANKER